MDKFTACTFLSYVVILPWNSKILSKGLIYDVYKANVSSFHMVLGGQYFSFNVISSEAESELCYSYICLIYFLFQKPLRYTCSVYVLKVPLSSRKLKN